MGIEFVKLKLGKMRKVDECVVYPPEHRGLDGAELLFIQGDRLVALIDPVSRACRYNYRTGSQYPTSWHLINHPNIETCILPEDLVDEIKRKQPMRGARIGGGVEIA